MTWLRRSASSTERNPFCYGKAVLCSNIHQRSTMKIKISEVARSITLRARSREELSKLTDSEVAEAIKKSGDEFLKSEEWFKLKAKTIAKQGSTCLRCKRSIKKWNEIYVDHIKPRKFFPHLANDENNLQVLCGSCNKSKGNKHDTDYRSSKDV